MNYINTKKYNPAISFVKVIAMFLIIHSHSDVLFPDRISFLATGGALGNELFFLVGGYLYSTKRKIGETTYRRFIRLYIPTYIMTILLYVFGIMDVRKLLSVRTLIHIIIWPTAFWFVSAVFFAGVIFHFLYLKSVFSSIRSTVIFSLIFVTVYIFLYVFFIPDKTVWIVEDYKFFNGMFYYKCVYSFAVFCLGNYLKHIQAINKIKEIDAKFLFVGSLITFCVFYLFKYALEHGIVPMKYQIISQPITVICVVFIMLWVLKSSRINDWLDSSPKIANFMNRLGEITLEAFLVQFEIVSLIKRVNIPFPVNYLINVFVIILAAYMFHKINNVIYQCIINRIKLQH